MRRQISAFREKLLSALPLLTPTQRAARDVIGSFETLGDNCEFGFVQRRLGLESGGLLRWAGVPPDSLTRALEDGFSDLYRFENLSPCGPRMVLDSAYGLAFHTDMTSHDGSWLQDEAARRRIHAVELRKYTYLRQKLLSRLADPARIFVYKVNPPYRSSSHPELVTAFRAVARAQLLLVDVADDPARIGAVVPYPDGVAGCHIGYIDRFAPYDDARAISGRWWSLVVTAARVCRAGHGNIMASRQ